MNNRVRPNGRSRNYAHVPANSAIQPPQAFVDVLSAVLDANEVSIVSYLTGKGITVVSTSYLSTILSGLGSVDLSGNAITNTDAILSYLVAHNLNEAGTLDISGGTSLAPTATDITVTVTGTESGTYRKTTNVNSRPSYTVGTKVISWSGTQWQIKVNAVLIDHSTDDVATPDLVTTWASDVAGNIPVLSTVNADKVALVAAGWTITTN